MSIWDRPPLHDFPQRAICTLQAIPRHLRDLVHEVAPHLVDQFDWERAESLREVFTLENWQQSEADLIFRIPYRIAGRDEYVLVVVLVEHQSTADPVMALRVLLYAARYWERQWLEWENKHEKGERLRLHPILPVVLHTENHPWTQPRQLAELIEAPAELAELLPQWPIRYWEIALRTPEELLASPSEWLRALAVVRAEEESAEQFLEVLRQTLQGIATAAPEHVRWCELVRFVVSWSLRRRPLSERDEILETGRQSQQDEALRREVEQMSEQVGLSWEGEVFQRIRQLEETARQREEEVRQREEEVRQREEEIRRLEEEARQAEENARQAEENARQAEENAQQAQQRTLRNNLLRLLRQRFGSLPPEVEQRIEQVNDSQRLEDALVQVLSITSPDQLQL
jgi:hypothetical protein